MSSKDFMNEMLAAGIKHSAKPRTSGQMTVSLAYQCLVKGHKWNDFIQPFNDPADAERVALDLTEKAKSAGGNSEARIGIFTFVPAETVLNYDSEWDQGRFSSRDNEREDFQTVWDAVVKLGVSLGKPFWCKYEQIDSPSAVSKGEGGKYKNQNTGEMVYPRILVPVGLYKDEAEARTAVGSSSSDTVDGISYDQLSEKAKKAHHNDVQAFLAQAKEVVEWIGKAQAGDSITGRPIDDYKDEKGEISHEIARMYVADCWSYEYADVELLESHHNPLPF